MSSAYCPLFPSPLSFISIDIKVSNLLNKNGVGEEILSTTDDNGGKGTL